MKNKIAIIGSGFSALSAACYLAKDGFNVSVFEKNDTVGGRCRQFKKDGFTFDMGPSWYWMPDIFDKFFNDFDKKTSDFYQLDKLAPAYKIFFNDEVITIGDTMEKICEEFERIEKGSSIPLKKFINKAADNYNIAINKIVLKPGVSPLELVTKDTVTRLDQFFKTISSDVRRQFKNPKLISTLEFPVLFLGAKPSNTPSFYSFMNYADFGLGTWHPKGGMYQIILAMRQLAEELGVTINVNSNVTNINVENNTSTSITVNGKTLKFDVVLSGADYHHSETLLDRKYRQYSEKYWNNKTFAPSSLLFYVGFDKKLKNVNHHNLFFDTNFETHAEDIYDNPKWPKEPLFYANFPSVTDNSMAPNGKENGFFLIPIAPNLEDTPQLREQYFDIIMSRFEKLTQQDVKNSIIFKESFCVKDFIEAYNSYKGNAYGMANTLTQTAFLRPNLKSKKVNNLYFTGQLTVPGPGVPPALISGKLVAELIQKHHQKL
ncbi:phytoene desaturase [Mesoflavibacter sabulilitoris]|uniref:Phytoene desaturase n=1 Tax=Mesoflavibacter zeaxanthinifaciens subsp. sabulilitoris TaxID=1520893 RepID=A0A2T1NB61_9FLAO|nr:phytoene desaturase family protein [Mesoflavibacter zeaxanthinifaciens]MBB3123484.1 phytoene desaturase [Mesoflavibacter zeaxanthinifaciens subsp. sabulilitoris]MCP4052171.1 phytoene desaturase [Mesoflavibacter sp.]PSG89384.1 phytoene desaturase [Mesoflavibacter zeaxanthinifaciens subsp. sabulilitoris]